jgi:catalase
MSNYVEAPAKAERSHLRKVSTLARFALIGVALAAVAGAFACLGGWLTPHALTPARFTDAFERADGVHPGFRRNHAKGVGVSGFFDSNGSGILLSTATVFRQGRVPVSGRFSLAGGNPYMSDAPVAVRGLGLQFSPPSGGEWRTAMINLPVFPVRTPEAFYERLVAGTADPATGKPDPAKMASFLARHPETARALAVIEAQPASSGFGDSTFHGLNAFRFTNAAGDTVPVRWLTVPVQSVLATGPGPQEAKYLFEGLIAEIHRKPLRWRLVVIVGQAGDATDDATVPWPADREQVEVGTLTLDAVEGEETSAATDLNFDPLVLPSGIATSDDPLLSARSAVYARSFTRREGEAKRPSAVTPADVNKGKDP